MQDVKERFLRFVEVIGQCWVWKGWTNSNEQGMFLFEGKKITAAKASYLIYKRDSYDGSLFIYKSCENKLCVNPEHLYLRKRSNQVYVHKTVKERFLEKVSKTENCWVWEGANKNKNWGTFFFEGRMRSATEVSYTLFLGALKEDQGVRPVCGNSLCVKPEHLVSIDVKTRFLSHVRKTEDCWFWLGAKNLDGYGEFSYAGKIQKASRVSYILFKGTIADKLQVLHKCDNPSCVNPDHLFLGTQSDNMFDMHKKGRHNSKRVSLGMYEEIVRLRKGGLSKGEIAKNIGLTQERVSRLLIYGYAV